VAQTDETRVVTYLELDGSLEGRLLSKVKVDSWEINPKDNRFVNPRTDVLHIPRRFPTNHFLESERPRVGDMIQDKLEFQRRMIENDYRDILEQKRAMLEEKSPNSKAAKKLSEEMQMIEMAIRRLSSTISYKSPGRIGDQFVYVIETPHLSDDQLTYLNDLYHHNKRYTKSTDLIKLDMGFPFNELIFSDGKCSPIEDLFAAKRENGVLNLETFLNSSICSGDFETTDWNIITLSPEDKLTASLELIRKYHLTQDETEEKDLLSLTRSQLLDLVEEKRDSVREEQIVVGTLSYFRSVKDLLKGNWKESRHIIISVLPLAKSMGVKAPISDLIIKPELYSLSNQKELTDKFGSFVMQLNPFHMTGHNYLTFDYGKADQLGLELTIGINGEVPKYMWGLLNKYVKIRVSKGRMDIDPVLFYQHYSPWTLNNKLDTVFQDLTGRIEKKEMTHLVLEETIQRILKGEELTEQERVKIGDILHKYALRDSMKSLINGVLLAPEIAEMALMFRTLFHRVCSTDKKRLSEEYWNRRSLDKTLTFRYTDPRKESLTVTDTLRKIYRARGDTKMIKWEDFKAEDFHHRLMKYLAKTGKSKKGLAKCRLIYLHPHVEALKDFFINDENAMRIYNRSSKPEEEQTSKGLGFIKKGFEVFRNLFIDKKTKELLQEMLHTSKSRIRGYRALEAIIEYPLFKIMEYSDKKLTKLMNSRGDKTLEWRFSKEFNLQEDSNNIQKYHNRLVKYYKSLKRGLENETVVNQYRNFILVKDSDTIDDCCQKIEEYNFGTVFGEVDALSIADSMFAASYKGQLINFGFADPRSNKGKKNEATKDTLKIILNKMLVERDFAEALKAVRDLSWGIQNNLIEEEMLQYKVDKVKKNFSEYSDAATQWYIPKLVEKRIRVGETYIYNPDVKELMEEVFGVKIDFYDGRIHYELTKEGRKKQTPDGIALDEKENLGKEKAGHVRRLIEAAFPLDLELDLMRPQQDLFEREAPNIIRGVLTGTATNDEIEHLDAFYKGMLGWHEPENK